MKMQKLNLFIVANNALVVNGLKHFLEDRFGDGLNISNFYSSKSCLKNLKGDTQVIVMDYFLQGRSASEILKSINNINPNTRVVMHSSGEDVAAWIELYCRNEAVCAN